MVDDQSLPASSEAAPPSALPRPSSSRSPASMRRPRRRSQPRGCRAGHARGATGDKSGADRTLVAGGFTGAEPIPQGLEPGSIGHYGRAVAEPHPAALASNPPGAPGATSGAAACRKAVASRRVYYEHQTPAAVAHEVLPGHQYDSPSGRRAAEGIPSRR